MYKLSALITLTISGSAFSQNGACCLYDFLGTCLDTDEQSCLNINGCFISAQTCKTADCNAYASCIGGGIGAIFADTKEFVGFDPIPPGTDIQYWCILSFGDPNSQCVSLVEGDLTVTFPNGIQQKILDNHPQPITNCKPIIVISDTYTTSLDDIAQNGALVAFLDYGQTIRVDQDNPFFVNGPQAANSVGLGFPTNLIGAQAACINEDLTRDGTVNIEDLNVIIKNFGVVKPAIDCNEDGIIDVLDLIDVIVSWSEDCPENTVGQPPYIPQHGAWHSYKFKSFAPIQQEYEYSIIVH